MVAATRKVAPDVRLVVANTPALIEAARTIFREYANSLTADMCLPGFEDEVAQLPGEYAAPTGQLVLALVDGELAACGALRPLHDVDYANACEMKRLYVRPAFRRIGLGRTLAQSLLDEARCAGYSVLLLDTLDEMDAARGLYRSLGFVEIPAYCHDLVAESHCLKVSLN